MGQLDGKVAIVTGSGRGIGQQVALRLARDGAAVILSSHLLSLVEEVCTHLLVLKNGRKVADGSVEAVRARFGASEDDSLEDVFFRATDDVHAAP